MSSTSFDSVFITASYKGRPLGLAQIQLFDADLMPIGHGIGSYSANLRHAVYRTEASVAETTVSKLFFMDPERTAEKRSENLDFSGEFQSLIIPIESESDFTAKQSFAAEQKLQSPLKTIGSGGSRLSVFSRSCNIEEPMNVLPRFRLRAGEEIVDFNDAGVVSQEEAWFAFCLDLPPGNYSLEQEESEGVWRCMPIMTIEGYNTQLFPLWERFSLKNRPNPSFLAAGVFFVPMDCSFQSYGASGYLNDLHMSMISDRYNSDSQESDRQQEVLRMAIKERPGVHSSLCYCSMLLKLHMSKYQNNPYVGREYLDPLSEASEGILEFCPHCVDAQVFKAIASLSPGTKIQGQPVSSVALNTLIAYRHQLNFQIEAPIRELEYSRGGLLYQYGIQGS